MNEELTDMLVTLKMRSKILTQLIDTILDSCELDFMEKDLSIRKDLKILTIIKTFFPDEYEEAFRVLTDKREEVKDNG